MLLSTSVAKLLARRSAVSSAIGGIRGMASTELFDDYGKHVFSGAVADEYLKKHGASSDVLKDPSWTETHADVVASAVLDW